MFPHPVYSPTESYKRILTNTRAKASISSPAVAQQPAKSFTFLKIAHRSFEFFGFGAEKRAFWKEHRRGYLSLTAYVTLSSLVRARVIASKHAK